MSTSDLSRLLVEVRERIEVYDSSFLKVWRARLRYRRNDGQLSDETSRLVVHHGNAVGVLAYDPQADLVVLVRQFRYPVYDILSPGDQQGEGARQAWLLEIVAGIEEQGQSAEETARRELREETGYEVSGKLEPIYSVYTSPGSNDERITLFVAEIDTDRQRQGGGGLAEEGEDTELVLLPIIEALAMLERGEIRDAKTVIALQHLALRRLRAGGSSAPATR